MGTLGFGRGSRGWMLSASMALISLLSVSAGFVFADCAEVVKHTQPCPHSDTWEILCPNVRQRTTEYIGIGFQPGDRITIEAGGCVQTGGKGLTWKRYVDPRGPNSDRLYHGTFRLGSGSKRLADYIGPIRIPTDYHGSLSLELGYEDDNYGDNGYDEHDDGTGDQCRGVGNAWLRINIVHVH